MKVRTARKGKDHRFGRAAYNGRSDPSGTLHLRRQFAEELRRVWNVLAVNYPAGIWVVGAAFASTMRR
jgi:hypothetical protein